MRYYYVLVYSYLLLRAAGSRVHATVFSRGKFFHRTAMARRGQCAGSLPPAEALNAECARPCRAWGARNARRPHGTLWEQGR